MRYLILILFLIVYGPSCLYASRATAHEHRHRLKPLNLFKDKVSLFQTEAALKENRIAYKDKIKEYGLELKAYNPWYTGPLLAPVGIVVPQGHVNVQLSNFLIKNYGVYKSNWTPNPRTRSSILLENIILAEAGIFHLIELDVIVSTLYKRNGDSRSYHYGDSAVALATQITRDFYGTWSPDLRFTLREVIPTGRYQNFNPRKYRTQSSGTGSWKTSFSLDFQKQFYLLEPTTKLYVPFRIRGDLTYQIASKVDVVGYNHYGGDVQTIGTVNPGNNLFALLGIEYSFTQSWVASIDAEYVYTSRTSFSGTTRRKMKGPSRQELNLVPAVEYNFSDRAGILAGVWFSVAGRNSEMFVSGILTGTYLF